jgi:hypothetical protein
MERFSYEHGIKPIILETDTGTSEVKMDKKEIIKV